MTAYDMVLPSDSLPANRVSYGITPNDWVFYAYINLKPLRSCGQHAVGRAPEGCRAPATLGALRSSKWRPNAQTAVAYPVIISVP